MATVALRRPAALGQSISRLVARVDRLPDAVILGALILCSLALRTLHMRTPFWIDEGLSVGIASHAVHEIPGLLRLDGSPPLYYVVLHFWMGVFGRSEVATHALSLLIALATIPAAWWAGRSLFGRRVGWALAVLAAINPFLTAYAQETRMYTLVVLLSMLATACFLHAFVFGRRRYLVPFGLLLGALLYTHNWAFFFAAGLVAALYAVYRATEDRRALLRDAAIGFGVAALVYLPWVPTLVYQALHTGAPWAQRPSPRQLIQAPDLLLGGSAGTIAVLLAGGSGLLALRDRSHRDRVLLVPALVALALAPIVVAWLASQASPAWATRYLAIAVAPLLLLASVALLNASRLGVAAFCVLLVSWTFAGSPSAKSNAHYVSVTFAGWMRPGDLVVSTQPEQVPVLAYYLPPGLRYFNPFGPVADTGIVDWRDGPAHFDRTGVGRQLLPYLSRLPVGKRVMLVEPIVFFPDRWTAPWTSRVWDRTIEYDGIMRGDRRFRLVGTVPTNYRLPGPNPLLGLLFEKVRPG